MKKTIVAAIFGMMALTGCTTLENKADSQQEVISEVTEADKIVEKMEEMGITGNVFEGSTSDDTTPPGALRNGVDEFVEVTTTSGDKYYGAVIDGEIEVWEDGDYDKRLLSDTSEYTKNTIIQITPEEGYSGDVTIYLYNYNSQGGETLVVREEDGYVLNIDLDEGDYDITGYDLADGYADTYALNLVHFTVSGEQTVVQTEIFKTTAES